MTGLDSERAIDASRQPTGFDDYELRLGDIIRGERATLGKSLLDVQRDIKIKANYLAAIEDADLDAFETPGFIAGYIRSYARYLDLNPDWAYRMFCAESGFSHVEGVQAQIHSKKPKPSHKPDETQHQRSGDELFARSPIYAAKTESAWSDVQPGVIGSFAVLILLIAGLGYGGWSALREIQKVNIAPVETALGAAPPGGAVDSGPMAEQGGAAPSQDRIDRLYRPQALEAPVLVARDGPISSLDPREQGAYGARNPVDALLREALSVPEPSSARAVAENAPQEVPDTVLAATSPNGPAQKVALGDVQVTAARPPEVVLFAREPVWVRVRAADGTVLLEKILDSGERYVLPQTEDAPNLRAGNSGALYFAVNGKTIGPAGDSGAVVSDVSLAATELAAAYDEIDLTADPELARLAEVVIAAEPSPPVAISN